jgi:hypothetical protein
LDDGSAPHFALNSDLIRVPRDFGQELVTDHEVVIRQDHLEQVGTESPRREGTDDDIRIEVDLHEMSRKTSSSVR